MIVARYLSGLAIVLALSVQSSARHLDLEPSGHVQDPIQAEQDGHHRDAFAVDIVTRYNRTFKFPFYRDVTKLEQSLRDEIVSSSIVLLEFADNVSERVLLEPSSFFGFIKYFSIAKDLISLMREGDTKVAALNIEMPYFKERRAENKRLLISILDRAKMLCEEYDEYGKPAPSVEQTRHNFRVFAESLIDCLKVSPVGSYWSWSTATVDGEPFMVYMSDLLAQLRHHGLGTSMTLVQALFTAYY